MSAEENLLDLGLFHIKSANGSMSLLGQYRTQYDEQRNNFKSRMESYLYTGMFNLNTNNYLWHPNFMELGIGLNYNPGAHKENYIILPNRSESVNAEGYNINATILKALPINLNLFTNSGKSYTSRDQANDLEMFTSGYGGTVNFINNFMPVTVGYNNTKWDQTELLTKRKYSNNSKIILANTNLNVGSFNENTLSLSINDTKSNTTGSEKIRNKISDVVLNNKVFFDKEKKNTFSSFLTLQKIEGYQQLDRIDENLSLNIIFPEDFRLFTNYQYSQFNQNGISNLIHNPMVRLEHQLYASLHTYTFFQNYDIKNNEFEEIKTIAALGLNYQKMTLLSGMLFMNYELRGNKEKRVSDTKKITIQNDEYTLNDGRIVLIKNPNIDIESVVVRNNNGSIIYKNNIDYRLIAQGGFLEIRRIIGGLIPDGGSIFVDYVISKSNPYNYITLTHSFDGRWSILKNLLEIHTNLIFTDNSNLDLKTTPILRVINQKLFGIQSTYASITAGAEVVFYNSNILPYNSRRFYLNYNDLIWNAFFFAINGNYQDYTYTETNTQQKAIEINSNLEYLLTDKSSIRIEGVYNSQKSTTYVMDIINLKAEFKYNIYQIYCSAGIETFFRKINAEKSDYRSVFIKLERRF